MSETTPEFPREWLESISGLLARPAHDCIASYDALSARCREAEAREKAAWIAGYERSALYEDSTLNRESLRAEAEEQFAKFVASASSTTEPASE